MNNNELLGSNPGEKELLAIPGKAKERKKK
jgi:hypothetical protein